MLKLEDLAYISDFTRIANYKDKQAARFIQAVKPMIMESWEDGSFKEKEQAVMIATKFTIATAQVFKYRESEPELWETLISMLKWSLKA